MVALKFDVQIDDGTCVIEIYQTMRGRIVHDVASSGEIGDVAWDMMNECVASGKGGVANGLGVYYSASP